MRTRPSPLAALLKRARSFLHGLPALAARVFFGFREQAGRGSQPGVAVATAVGLATVLVAAVVLSSCVVPARRVLAVEASEARRTEG